MNPTNPEPEVETPSEEVQDQSTEAKEARARDDKGRFAKSEQPAEPEAEATPEVTPEPEEELDEIEYEGKRYAVAKPLKPLFMMNADYTRKTQEVAEQKKAIEAEKLRIQKEAESHKAELKAHAEVLALEAQLEEFKNTDWNKLTDEDPVKAQKLWMAFNGLKDARQQRLNEISSREQQRALEQQQKNAKLTEEGRSTLAREIKDWSPDLESKLKSYVKGHGLDKDEIPFALYPQEAKILYKAYQYDQLMQKAQAKPKPAEPKPVTTVGQSNRASPQGLSDDLPIEEWHRRWQQKQRRTS